MHFVRSNANSRQQKARLRKVFQFGALLLLLAPLAILGGCSGVVSAGNASVTPPQISTQLSPLSLTFSNVAIGQKTSLGLLVMNSGQSSITLTNATTSATQFSTSGVTLPMTLATGQTANITVWFSNNASGSVTGTLTLNFSGSSGATSTATVPLSATVLAAKPQLSISPASVSFGKVTTGATANSAVTLTNAGSADLTISVITVSGSSFGVSGITTPKTIPAGQFATLTATYSPTAAQNDTGSISITSNDPASPSTIALSGTGSATAVGQLTLNPTNLSFGGVTVGSNSTLPATVTNSGQAPVQISGVTVSGSGFTATGVTTPSTLSVGQSATLQVKYAPTAAGAVTGSVSIASNAGGSPTVLNLTGTGTQAGLSASPTTVNFGSVTDGQTKTQTISLSNTGTASLTVTQITASGTGFSTTGLTMPLTIAAGQSSSFTAQFAPQTGGSFSGSLSIVSNAPNSPTAVSLSGTGVALTPGLSANPASVNFGSVIDGQTKSQTITLTNTGTGTLTITQVTSSGTGLSVNGLTTPLTIAAGQSSSFNAQFAPTTAASYSGSLSVVSNAPNSPTAIAWTGTGTAASSTLTATPSNWNFGNVTMGASASQNVTITNTGNTTANISQMTVTGTGYSISGITTPTAIAPAQSATLTVQFAPSTLGAANGTVALLTTQGQTLNITASATGVQAGLSVTPASVGFGSVSTGSSSSQTVQLKNTGNTTLTITQAAITGAGFSDTGLTLPQSIAAGATANFNVQFAPQSASSVTGSLTLTSNAPNSPTGIALTGTGVASTLTLSITPASLSFGSITTGTTTTKTFSVTNTGNANVAISSITASGTGFSILSGGGAVTLTPTQSVTVTVQFSPSTATAASGNVSIVSNATGSPASVTLSGTGVAPVQHSAALNWTASTSTVSGYNVYRGTVSGGPYTKINSSLVAGVTYTDTTVVSGTTYYYVTTAVDSSNNESNYSNEVQAVIP